MFTREILLLIIESVRMNINFKQLNSINFENTFLTSTLKKLPFVAKQVVHTWT